MDHLEEYTYRPLQDPSQDIRLVQLLPAHGKSQVRIKIHHASLAHARTPPKPHQLVVAESLPPGWTLRRTHQGRHLFQHKDSSRSQWEHPSPESERSAFLDEAPDELYDPQYEALSYAWGSSVKPQSIVVEATDALASRTKLAATDNLVDALQHMNRGDASRMLWIDAICINQSDDVEKSRQVYRMSQIYRSAERVIVWLGPAADDSSHALQTLQYIASQSEIDVLQACWILSPSATELEWADPAFVLPYGRETWDAILALLRRDWYSRLWVAQEIHLADPRRGAIVQCGSDTIDYAELRRAIACLEHRHLPYGELKSQINSVWTLFRLMPDGIMRSVLKTITEGRACKEPRDKIYGALGLAPRRFAERVMPDYSDKTSTGDIYKSALLLHAEIVQRLECFSFCSMAARNVMAPSWVPDWSTAYSHARPRFSLASHCAAGASRAHYKHSQARPELLEVTGVRCGVVSHVTEPLRLEGDSWSAVQHVRKWEPRELADGAATYGPTGESLRRAYAITIVKNRLKERWPQYNVPSTADWADQNYQDALFGQGAAHANDADGCSVVTPHVRQALQYCQRRMFFRTDEGFMGLAPQDTKLGDVVAVILGGLKPLVLRPNSATTYQIVGECFVYGLHDSIKLLGPLPPPWRVTMLYTSDGRDNFKFYNKVTGESTKEDPRLEPLSLTQWERTERDVTGDDPMHYDFFESKVTGEVINYDPRMEPEALGRRRVDLEALALV